MRIFIAILIALSLSCCPIDNLLIEVVSDHREISVETVDVLLSSIRADAAERELTEEESKQVDILIDRLEYMKRSSVVIEQYIMNKADKEDLAQVIRDKIKGEIK